MVAVGAAIRFTFTVSEPLQVGLAETFTMYWPVWVALIKLAVSGKLLPLYNQDVVTPTNCVFNTGC